VLFRSHSKFNVVPESITSLLGEANSLQGSPIYTKMGITIVEPSKFGGTRAILTVRRKVKPVEDAVVEPVPVCNSQALLLDIMKKKDDLKSSKRAERIVKDNEFFSLKMERDVSNDFNSMYTNCAVQREDVYLDQVRIKVNDVLVEDVTVSDVICPVKIDCSEHVETVVIEDPIYNDYLFRENEIYTETQEVFDLVHCKYDSNQFMSRGKTIKVNDGAVLIRGKDGFVSEPSNFESVARSFEYTSKRVMSTNAYPLMGSCRILSPKEIFDRSIHSSIANNDRVPLKDCFRFEDMFNLGKNIEHIRELLLVLYDLDLDLDDPRLIWYDLSVLKSNFGKMSEMEEDVLEYLKNTYDVIHDYIYKRLPAWKFPIEFNDRLVRFVSNCIYKKDYSCSSEDFVELFDEYSVLVARWLFSEQGFHFCKGKFIRPDSECCNEYGDAGCSHVQRFISDYLVTCVERYGTNVILSTTFRLIVPMWISDAEIFNFFLAGSHRFYTTLRYIGFDYQFVYSQSVDYLVFWRNYVNGGPGFYQVFGKDQLNGVFYSLNIPGFTPCYRDAAKFSEMDSVIVVRLCDGLKKTKYFEMMDIFKKMVVFNVLSKYGFSYHHLADWLVGILFGEMTSIVNFKRMLVLDYVSEIT